MLTLLTAGEKNFPEKIGTFFQLLHCEKVENSWSVPLLETVWHSYCQGGEDRFSVVCQDPPMELYLWYAIPPAPGEITEKRAGLSTNPGPSGEKTVETVEGPGSFPPSAALALTGETLTLCAPAERLPFLDRQELEQFVSLHQIRRIECGGVAAQWLSVDAVPDLAASRTLERRPALVWSGGASPLRERLLAEGATLSDRPRLDGIHALLSQAYPGFSTPRDFWIYDTSRRIRRGCARILAAEDSRGRILATAGCYAAGKETALISGVATHPDARRRGYGTALVTALASLLSVDGKTVWIIPVDSYAQQLYTSIGFTLSGKFHCIFQ